MKVYIAKEKESTTDGGIIGHVNGRVFSSLDKAIKKAVGGEQNYTIRTIHETFQTVKGGESTGITSQTARVELRISDTLVGGSSKVIIYEEEVE